MQTCATKINGAQKNHSLTPLPLLLAAPSPSPAPSCPGPLWPLSLGFPFACLPIQLIGIWGPGFSHTFRTMCYIALWLKELRVTKSYRLSWNKCWISTWNLITNKYYHMDWILLDRLLITQDWLSTNVNQTPYHQLHDKKGHLQSVAKGPTRWIWKLLLCYCLDFLKLESQPVGTWHTHFDSISCP